MKCYQCPVAFHKECLGGEGYRGKWLCYLCKIVKKGVYEESTIVSALKEARLCSKLSKMLLRTSPPSPSFVSIAKEVIKILTGYHCSELFKDDLQHVLDEPAYCTKEAFIERVLELIPEEGSNAFYTLRLFESLVSTDEVFETA
jgi:hypothetical protein